MADILIFQVMMAVIAILLVSSGMMLVINTESVIIQNITM